MPKMKTKSSAKKRFKVTSSGKVKAKQAKTRHMMINKSQKMKRTARGTTVLCAADGEKILKNYLPYKASKRRKSKPRKAANDNPTTKAGA